MNGLTIGGIAHINHRAEYVVVNVNQLGGIFGLLQRFSDDHGHMVTHKTGFALGQNGMWRLFHGRAVGAGDQPAARQAVHLVSGDIVAGKHGQHARCLACFIGMNAVDAGMRMRGTHKNGV